MPPSKKGKILVAWLGMSMMGTKYMEIFSGPLGYMLLGLLGNRLAWG